MMPRSHLARHVPSGTPEAEITARQQLVLERAAKAGIILVYERLIECPILRERIRQESERQRRIRRWGMA